MMSAAAPHSPPVGIVRPLNLRDHLSNPRERFDTVPIVDLFLIGLFFVLAGSRFMFAPGLAIDLPVSGDGPTAGLPPTAVLTVQDRELILFEGRKVPLSALSGRLHEFVAAQSVADPVLLVKADRNVDIQDILAICEFARSAGFVSVQLAAQEVRIPEFPFPADGR